MVTSSSRVMGAATIDIGTQTRRQRELAGLFKSSELTSPVFRKPSGRVLSGEKSLMYIKQFYYGTSNESDGVVIAMLPSSATESLFEEKYTFM